VKRASAAATAESTTARTQSTILLMPDERKSKFPIAFAVVLVVCFFGVLVWSGGWLWAGFQAEQIQRAILPERKPEGNVYDATAKGPVSLANFVRELRVAWPGENVATVHAAACELATGLLHHGDIEVGSLEGKTFVPWSMSRWEAARKIDTELKSMHDFLQDENRYVFRRK